MAIVAAHMLLYTPEADAVRAVLRDVFEWKHVEDHPGWLIFALPPSELGVHPSEGSTEHQICLMCDDLAQTVVVLKRSMNPGFAGIENPLFYNPKTVMLFGDAKESIVKLVQDVKTL